MTKREMMKLSDNKLDKVVKIQGTNYDRKRKVTKQMQYRMMQMLNAGKSYKTIAEHFDVTPHTVKYNTNPEYKKWWNTTRDGKHYGPNLSDSKERGAYKRELLRTRKELIYAQ